MRILNAKDMMAAVNPEKIIAAIEKALVTLDGGDYYMPDRMHLDYKGNTQLLMPAFLPDISGTKLVSLFPGNAKKNQALLQGIMLLQNGETGKPLALIEGSKLTAIRTAAVGSTGVKWLAPPETESIGIIGAGVQGYHQAWFACKTGRAQKLICYDKTPEKAERLLKDLQTEFPNLETVMAKDAANLCQEAEVIITATTSSAPVIPDDTDLLEHKTIIGIGSYKPEMREFSEAIYQSMDHCFVDTQHATKESGDLRLPLSEKWISGIQISLLSDVIAGKRKIAFPGTYVFKSVGMALFDLFVAQEIYNYAFKNKLGIEIDF